MVLDPMAWIALAFLVSIVVISIGVFWWVLKAAAKERAAVELKHKALDP